MCKAVNCEYLLAGMTRDLDAMGLMTQVKKGDDVRKKGSRQGQHTNTGQQQQVASRQPAKLNLNMAN